MPIHAPTPSASGIVRTETENALAHAGISAVELGRVSAAGRTHVALLVDDDDADAAKAATRGLPGLVARIFTVNGRKAGAYRLADPRYRAITLAVFPFDLAEGLLSLSAQSGGLDAECRYRVAVYVATYFGSCARMLGLEAAQDEGHLPRLAQAAGLDPAQCSDRLCVEGYLASVGWRPPGDMLERLGLTDPWLRDELLPSLLDHHEVAPGLALFFCRARAVQAGYLDTIRKAVEETGFEILHSIPLTDEATDLVRKSTRGGNWGAGPLPENGGPPVHLMFAVDVFPYKPPAAIRAVHPFLDNGRTLAAKMTARDAVWVTMPARQRFNPLHSADTSAEVLRIAELVLPADQISDLGHRFASRMDMVAAARGDGDLLDGSNPVAAHLRLGGDGGRRLRKIYRPQFASAAAAVARVQDDLAVTWPEFPFVTEQGKSHLDFAALGEGAVPLDKLAGALPLPAVLRLREMLRATAAAGVLPVGWAPGQGVFFTPSDGALYLPGFDRIRHVTAGATLEDLVPGGGADLAGSRAYRALWSPVLGLPRGLFVRGTPSMMRAYRTMVYPCRRGGQWAVRYLGRVKPGLRRGLRPLVRALRR